MKYYMSSTAGLHSWTAAYCLVYINDLPSSKILNPIMFADDTNLLYERKSIIKLFATVNEELMNTNNGK